MISIKNLIILAVYVIDLAFFAPQYTLRKFDGSPKKRQLLYKGITIGILWVMTIAGAVWGFFVSKTLGRDMIAVASLLCVAMTICAVGDIVLEIHFIRGGILFAIGHLCYITAMFLLGAIPNAITAVVFVAVAGSGAFIACKRLNRKHRVPVVMYDCVIGLSFAMGVTLMYVKAPLAYILGTGICMLVISDWLLAKNKAFGTNYYKSLTSLLFYFGGQALISSYLFRL